MGRQEAITHVEYPFGKDMLRSGGTQWSTEYTDTGDGTTWQTGPSVTIQPPAIGKIIELEIGVTYAAKNSSTGSDVLGRVVGRNKDGTWVVLCDSGTSPATGNAYITTTDDCTTYQEVTIAGRINTTTNLNSVPFDLALQYQREATTGTATVKVKNTSYVRVVYR